ncbi:MAG: hypothetical protein O3B24_02405 [Verrucomicrobia bacterium]|nr:hypothetical protein [Verrucomicrobiota bacterium]
MKRYALFTALLCASLLSTAVLARAADEAAASGDAAKPACCAEAEAAGVECAACAKKSDKACCAEAKAAGVECAACAKKSCEGKDAAACEKKDAAACEKKDGDGKCAKKKKSCCPAKSADAGEEAAEAPAVEAAE